MFSEIAVLCNRPSCRLWANADPTTDTIKVEPSRFDKDHHLQFYKDDGGSESTSKENVWQENLQRKDGAQSHENSRGTENSLDKENLQPPPLEVAAFQAAMKERQEQEEMRQKALQEARARRDEERRLEKERRAAEKLQVERMAVERRERELQRAEEETVAARRRSEENLQRLQEMDRKKEQELKEAEEAKREKDEQAVKSVKAAEEKKLLEDFLAGKGYSGVNAKRTRMLKSKYPLHTAVKDNSLELVELLLAACANPTLKNSAGLTPAHLAMKLNTKGSHDAVIRALQKIRTSDS